MGSSIENSTNSDEQRLLAEYAANVALWQHDDMLRQQRNANFLTVNTILVVALSAVIGISSEPASVAVAAIAFFLLGFPVCLVWRSVMVRNAEYVRFRRFQLRSIESRLPGVTTFTNTYKAFYQKESIPFAGLEETFSIKPSASAASTLTEGRLPGIIAGFWLAVFAGGVVTLILAWLGKI